MTIQQQPVDTPGRVNVPTLRVNNLGIAFGGIVAVRGVAFSIDPGEVLGLIGPNGAGKSTVLNCISGVYRPSSGTITVEGTDIGAIPSHLVRTLGVVRTFQETLLIDEVSVVENILLGRTKLGRMQQMAGILRFPSERRSYRDALASAASLLEDFGLSTWAHEKAVSVPYGVRKLTEVARAQISDPRLVLLDEPAAGLGGAETDILAHRISELAKSGIAVLLIDHNIEFVASIADRIIVMNSGSVFAEGTPSEVRADERVANAYLGSRSKDNA